MFEIPAEQYPSHKVGILVWSFKHLVVGPVDSLFSPAVWQKEQIPAANHNNALHFIQELKQLLYILGISFKLLSKQVAGYYGVRLDDVKITGGQTGGPRAPLFKKKCALSY